MPQTCSVCKSKHLPEIDKELVSGRPLRNIAERYRVSATALFRHKQNHLPEKLMLAKRHQEALSAEDLLMEMQDLKRKLWTGLEAAEHARNGPAILGFAREFRQTLESYFSLSERVAQKVLAAGAGATSLGLEETLDKIRGFYGLTPPPRAARPDYIAAVREALGFKNGHS